MPGVWKGDSENKSEGAWEKMGPWACWDTGLGALLERDGPERGAAGGWGVGGWGNQALSQKDLKRRV